MPETKRKIDLIRYEFIAYVYIPGAENVSDIFLTMDDLLDMKSQNCQINWISAENMDIDIIDNEVPGGDSLIGKAKKRICGLFDAEPLDWKHARITVDDFAKTRHSYAIARMPKSPIVPVYFNVKE